MDTHDHKYNCCNASLCAVIEKQARQRGEIRLWYPAPVGEKINDYHLNVTKKRETRQENKVNG
jgi:hypothetical protein